MVVSKLGQTSIHGIAQQGPCRPWLLLELKLEGTLESVLGKAGAEPDDSDITGANF